MIPTYIIGGSSASNNTYDIRAASKENESGTQLHQDFDCECESQIVNTHGHESQIGTI